MPLQDMVREAFAPAGVLSRAADEFRPRSGQTDMALAVARVIQQGGALVVEAGTGVGKTFAYLVPALLSGERVLLSTATKTLQDQLYGRDLPRLVQALGLPVRTALLKGRGSYLCLHRMALARNDAMLPDRTAVRTLAKVEEWAQVTRTGDLGETLPAHSIAVLNGSGVPIFLDNFPMIPGTTPPTHKSYVFDGVSGPLVSGPILTIELNLSAILSKIDRFAIVVEVEAVARKAGFFVPEYEAKKQNWKAAMLNLKGALDKYGIPFPAIPEVGITGEEIRDVDMKDIIPVF